MGIKQSIPSISSQVIKAQQSKLEFDQFDDIVEQGDHITQITDFQDFNFQSQDWQNVYKIFQKEADEDDEDDNLWSLEQQNQDEEQNEEDVQEIQQIIYDQVELEVIKPLQFKGKIEGKQLKNGIKILYVQDPSYLGITFLIGLNKGYHEELNTNKEGELDKYLQAIVLPNEPCFHSQQFTVDRFIEIDNSFIIFDSTLKDDIPNDCFTELIRNIKKPDYDFYSPQTQSPMRKKVQLILDKVSLSLIQINNAGVSLVVKSHKKWEEIDELIMKSGMDRLRNTVDSEAQQLEIPRSKFNNRIKYGSTIQEQHLVYEIPQQKQSMVGFVLYLASFFMKFTVVTKEKGYLILKVENGEENAKTMLQVSEMKNVEKEYENYLEQEYLEQNYLDDELMNIEQLGQKLIDKKLDENVVMERIQKEFNKDDYNHVCQRIQKGVIILEGNMDQEEIVMEPLEIKKNEEKLRLKNMKQQLMKANDTIVLCGVIEYSDLKYNVEEVKIMKNSEQDDTEMKQEFRQMKSQIYKKESQDCQEINEQLNEISQPFNILDQVWWKYEGSKVRIFQGIHIVMDYKQKDLINRKGYYKIGQKYYQESIKLENAVDSGFSYQIESNPYGYLIYLNGWSNTYDKFYNEFMKQFKKSPNDKKLFNTKRKEVINDFNQYYGKQLDFLIQSYYFPRILLRPVSPPDQIVSVVQSLNFNPFKSSKIVAYKTFFYGNIDINQAQQYANNILINNNPYKFTKTKTLSLKQHAIVYAQKAFLMSDDNNSTATLNYYQTGTRNIKTMSVLLLTQAYLQEKAERSQLLKNTEQFMIKFKSIGCTDGLEIYMQSKQSMPQEMNRYIELFLNAEKSAIKKMQEEQLNKIKHQVLLTLRYSPNGEYIWDKILYNNYGFTELDELRSQIMGLEIKDFKSGFENIFSCEECGKLSLQVYGEGSIEKNVELKVLGENDMLNGNENGLGRNEVYVESMDDLMLECQQYIECTHQYQPQ